MGKLTSRNVEKLMQNQLTAKQDTFALEVVNGCSFSDAYRRAYGAENMKPQVIHIEASRLAANPKVALRLGELSREKDEDRRLQAIRREDFVLDGLMHESVNAESDSARVRALELIGKTIGLFADRPIKEDAPELTAAELEQEIFKKLSYLSNP